MAMANLVNQDEALVEFLDDLLAELPDETEVAVNEAAAAIQSEAAEPEADITAVIPEPSSQAEEALPVEAEVIDESGRRLVIPEWGQQTFSAMVFKVRDLSLAIPVNELNGVVDWNTVRVEQQAGSMLQLGSFEHGGQSVTVVDTARFIFPENRLEELARQEGDTGLSRIILINNGKIGLACSEVYELVDIEPSQVTWRSDRTRRKWLSGTMLKEMIVILDAETTADILRDRLGL